MSLSITQIPAQVNLAQSPIPFSIYESGPETGYTAFQYCADLYYWTGSIFDSGSIPQYTLVKYPNQSKYGIFDLSKILNSSLQDLAETNHSNVKYFACDFYWQYQDGSGAYVTGTKTRSYRYKVLDGYAVFPEPIGESIVSKSLHYPIMSDGPTTQSFLDTNAGNMTVYTGYPDTFDLMPTKLTYTWSGGSADINVSGSLNTTEQTQYFPIGPTEIGFPLPTSVDWFTIQPYNNTTPIGVPLRFEIACQQKYPNVRIKWKNRFGQFDYFNFYMVSKTNFRSEKRSYQPQIGSWQGTSLAYNDYDSQNLNYLVDSFQGVIVNTFWVDEAYNDIFKQLLVSDEIYWVVNDNNNELRPITIVTNTVEFKTKAVDKLIQYSFEFAYGQNYKLII